MSLILGAIAAGAALMGVKKGLDAKGDNDKARQVQEQARHIYESAREPLESQRIATNTMLERLGTTRLKVWSEDLGAFVCAFKKFKNISWQGEVARDENIQQGMEKLQEMEKASFNATTVVTAGLGSLSAGALAGVAAYGGTMMLATASTGTAISALSGAAATNATLAWLGGGTLAAGGSGVLGGALVLGGVVAGPVLVVAGSVLAAKAEKNLAEAESRVAEARQKAAQMWLMHDALRDICDLAEDYDNFIRQYVEWFRPFVRRMETVCEQHYPATRAKFVNRLRALVGMEDKIRVDFADLSTDDQKLLHTTWIMAQTLQHLLTQNLVTNEGKRSEEAVTVLKEGKDLQ